MNLVRYVVTVNYLVSLVVLHTQRVIFLKSLFKYLILSLSAYDAQVAGLYYGISHTGSGFQVSI